MIATTARKELFRSARSLPMDKVAAAATKSIGAVGTAAERAVHTSVFPSAHRRSGGSRKSCVGGFSCSSHPVRDPRRLYGSRIFATRENHTPRPSDPSRRPRDDVVPRSSRTAARTRGYATTAAVRSCDHHRSSAAASSSSSSSSSYYPPPTSSSSDRLLVVGSGVAGCAAALIAAERHSVPVTLLYAGSLPTDCNSFWAQGGIIYRNYDPKAGDTPESLVNDVKRAGAGLSAEDAAWKLALEGPDRVRELLLDERGPFANVPFDRAEDGSLSLCLEASHAAARIIHRADSTGMAITEHITAAAVRHPLVTIVPETLVTDLAVSSVPVTGERVCVGAHVLNRRTRERGTIAATRGTVLASGGLAGIYEHSTNPPGFNALGSSAALARRAGASTRDLEYVQFHPTSLFIPDEARFLLTEALRGEGAILRDADGRAFAKDYHPDGELAPRDVVARAVFAESQKARDDGRHNAYLDITHRDESWLRGRFPTIDKHLLQRDMDITGDAIPVVPAAHYTCGGVETDLEGRTSLRGLYAAGEAARTGLHGGNRLASTSLLEGLVYGGAVADHVGTHEEGLETASLASVALMKGGAENPLEDSMEWYSRIVVNGEALSRVDKAKTLLADLKRSMWDYVGVVRTPAGLVRAVDQLTELRDEADELYLQVPTSETVGLRDAAHAGLAVAEAARANPVSRGAHTIAVEGVQGGAEGKDEDSDGEEEVMGVGIGI